MGNRAYLTRTKFEAGENEVDWGWRIRDDHLQSYTDCYQEHEVPTEPLALLEKAVTEASNEERDLFQHLLDNEQGLYLNGSWHDFEEIAPVLRKALDVED